MRPNPAHSRIVTVRWLIAYLSVILGGPFQSVVHRLAKVRLGVKAKPVIQPVVSCVLDGIINIDSGIPIKANPSKDGDAKPTGLTGPM
jgi:hypothetical protein